MTVATRLFQLDAHCPKCGAPPRIRATRRQIEKWQDEQPSELVQTYQCSWDFGGGRKCDTIYALTAGAFQRAHEIED